jgi:hypothetical protein
MAKPYPIDDQACSHTQHLPSLCAFGPALSVRILAASPLYTSVSRGCSPIIHFCVAACFPLPHILASRGHFPCCTHPCRDAAFGGSLFPLTARHLQPMARGPQSVFAVEPHDQSLIKTSELQTAHAAHESTGPCFPPQTKFSRGCYRLHSPPNLSNCPPPLSGEKVSMTAAGRRLKKNKVVPPFRFGHAASNPGKCWAVHNMSFPHHRSACSQGGFNQLTHRQQTSCAPRVPLPQLGHSSRGLPLGHGSQQVVGQRPAGTEPRFNHPHWENAQE